MNAAMVLGRILGLGTALLGLSGGTQAQTKTMPIEGPKLTTLCEVAKNPRKFDGKEVTFTAQYHGPGEDSSALVDMNFSDVAISPNVPSSAIGADALRSAYMTGHFGTIDKDIDATWTGVFHWRPRRLSSRVLIVREIRDITVSKK